MRAASALLLVVVLLVAGCGGQSLTADENYTVANANAAFASTVVDSSRYGETLDGVDQLIKLYREKPDAKYDGETMRQVLQDAASTLEEYHPDLASKLDRAIR